MSRISLAQSWICCLLCNAAIFSIILLATATSFQAQQLPTSPNVSKVTSYKKSPNSQLKW
jgi:hypothetical protein